MCRVDILYFGNGHLVQQKMTFENPGEIVEGHEVRKGGDLKQQISLVVGLGVSNSTYQGGPW